MKNNLIVQRGVAQMEVSKYSIAKSESAFRQSSLQKSLVQILLLVSQNAILYKFLVWFLELTKF